MVQTYEQSNVTVNTVTLAFLNYNTTNDLIHALKSVKMAAKDINVNVVVIDNGSTDNSVEILKKEFPKLKIIELKQNFGFAKGFNHIFNFEADYYFLLNSDIVLEPDSISKILAIIKKDEKIGLAGVKMLRQDGSEQFSYGKMPNLISELTNRSCYQKLNKKNKTDDYFEVESILGAVMIVPKITLQKVGPMDPRYFFFFEETDWCYRIRKAGLKVVHIPNVSVVHIQGVSANKVPIESRIEFHRSRKLFFKTHYGKISEYILNFGIVIRLIINSFSYLLLNVVTLALIPKFKNKFILYINVFAWYCLGCSENMGMHKPNKTEIENEKQNYNFI